MNLEKKLKETREEMEELMSLQQSGLSRYNLTSDNWHEKNKKASRYLFGIKKTWKETRLWLSCAFWIELATNKHDTEEKNSPLSELEELLVTLMRSRRSFGYETLSYILGKGTSTVSRCINKLMSLLGRRGLDMSILDLDYTHDHLSKRDCEKNWYPTLRSLTFGKI